jgi:hypothetical protein
METYNKIMQKVWLLITAIILVSVTYLCITEGFERWSFYYIFAGLTLLLYLVRRFMIGRMEKHQEYLKQKEEEARQQ